MNFIDYNQLYQDVMNLGDKLPDFDAVIGVPRSGILPAAMLATYKNKTLGYIDKVGNFGMLSGGLRDQKNWASMRLLVLDDSCDTGGTMNIMRDRISGMRATFAAVYVTDPKLVDHYGRVLEQPRMFAWNFMNHGLLANACVDIDGVLTVSETDFSTKYRPRYQIKYLVTGRLEERRKETVDWLNDNDIEYEQLIMRPNEKISAEEHKKNFYKKSGCVIFIESASNQAEVISEVGPVICTDNLTLYESKK